MVNPAPTTNSRSTSCEVAVVGGGPVGLLLGCCLRRLGIECMVLEREPGRSSHSRAIGVHPPSLEILQQLGLIERFLASGVKVQRGHARVDRRPAGSVSFESCPAPYRFVLAIPQDETERILEECLTREEPRGLQRGTTVTAVRDTGSGVELTARDARGEAVRVACQYAVGCDGRASLVRDAARIPFSVRPAPDSFVMGDVADTTDLGTEAYIFLGSAPLVESFPLPGKLRRWVLKSVRRDASPDAGEFRDEVLARTGHDLRSQPIHRLSAFGIERGLAGTFHRGRLALAGDAAHVMSPMGGQGMNVGWMDARDLATTLQRILAEGHSPDAELAAYTRRGRKRARRAIRRASCNTFLGRRWGMPTLLRGALRCVLGSPASPWLARVFTMRGLDSSPADRRALRVTPPANRVPCARRRKEPETPART